MKILQFTLAACFIVGYLAEISGCAGEPGGGQPPATSQPAAPPGDPGGPPMVPIVPHVALDPVAVRDSMQYLITTYGVSEAEALRRLELQNDAQQLEGMLQKELPDEYGGMWLDQDNGGVLVVAVTRPDSIRPYVGGMLDGGHVTSRKVAFSLRDLAAARDRLAKKLKEGPDATYLPAVDIPQNRVVLWQREWVKQEKLAGTWEATSLSKRPTMTVAMRSSQVSAEDDAAHEAVAAELPDMVAQAVFPRPAQSYTSFVDWGVCHPLYCPWWYGPIILRYRSSWMISTGDRNLSWRIMALA
jgi:streptogrisin C